MSESFEAQVDRIVVNTEKRMVLVMQESLQTVVERTQLPVAKGGRMRVDTGFLRASGQSSLNGMPTGPNVKPSDALKYQFDDGNKPNSQTTLVLSGMKFGATFFFGWTANYARYRELKDGFLSTVVQDWQKIVNETVEKAKQRFPK